MYVIIIIIIILHNENRIIFRVRKFVLNNGLTNTLGNFHNTRYTTQHLELSHLMTIIMRQNVAHASQKYDLFKTIRTYPTFNITQ